MDNFRIIQTLCRIGLPSSGPAFRFQVERLKDALHTDGYEKEAGALAELLKPQNPEQSLRPSRVVPSIASSFAGEILSPAFLFQSTRKQVLRWLKYTFLPSAPNHLF